MTAPGRNLPRRPTGRSRGFTFTELIAMIGVVAILSAMAVVGYSRIVRSARNAGTEAMMRDVAKSAQMLILTGKPLVEAIDETFGDVPAPTAASEGILALERTSNGWTIDDTPGAEAGSANEFVYTVGGNQVGAATVGPTGDSVFVRFGAGALAQRTIEVWSASGVPATGSNALAGAGRGGNAAPGGVATEELGFLGYDGAVTTVAGNGAAAYADGTGNLARFNLPSGVTSDGTWLYVADHGNNRIRKVMAATGVTSTLAGDGVAGNTDGPGTSARFDGPAHLTVTAGKVYVADRNNNVIRVVDVATGAVTTFAGDREARSVDGVGTDASLNEPYGITTDGTSLFVSELSGNKIRRIDIATREVTTLAGSGFEGGSDGVGPDAEFAQPAGLTHVDGSLFVADYANNAIRRVTVADGSVATLAGAGADNPGYVDSTGVASQFDHPQGVTTDGTWVYVADGVNNRIRRVHIVTGVTETLAGAFSGSLDGVGVNARFNAPNQLTTDGTALYVAGYNDNKIRKIVPELAAGSED